MTSLRRALPDFQLANPIYKAATVSVYETDADGEITTTLATLYRGSTGSGTLANPQTLDGDGKFAAPVFVDVAVAMEVVGPNVASHTTGEVIVQRGTWRSDWVTGTIYVSSDMVRDAATGDIYVAVEGFTGGASLAADVLAGHLELVLENELVNTNVPVLIGGSGAASTITIQSTSGVGTTDAIIFKVGNNGATEAGRFDTSGNLGLGTGATVSTKVHVKQTTNAGLIARLEVTSAGNAAAAQFEAKNDLGTIAAFGIGGSGLATAALANAAYILNVSGVAAIAIYNATDKPTIIYRSGVEIARFPVAGTAQLVLGLAGTSIGKLALSGSTSGTTTIQGVAAASGTWTLPAVTDQFVGKATTDVLTNKTITGLALSAGTITVAPLTIASGTNLTTAAAGAVEYDGKVFYASVAASSRGVVPAVQFLSLSANQTGTDTASAQVWFPGGGATGVTVVGTTSYFFEGVLMTSRAAGTTSHTIGLLFGGTATITSIAYAADAVAQDASAFTAVAGQQSFVGVATNFTVWATASTNAAQVFAVKIKGIVRINGAGTLIPQWKYSAAPGGAPTVLANSWFRLYPVGINTVLNVGNWS